MSVLVVFPLKTILKVQSTKLNDWSKIIKNELHGTEPSSVVPFWRYNINTLKKTCPGFDILKTKSATENGLDEISVTYIFQNVAPKPHHKVYL